MSPAKFGAVLLILCSTSLCFAHDEVSRQCAEPEVPPRSDVARWNAFVDELDDYRACIARFQKAQYAAADTHRTAAEAATHRWNQFVAEHLNVPADFPHKAPP